MKAWVLGGGKREVGGSCLIGLGYLGRDRCSGELPERADGKVDITGGAWEAEPGVLSAAVGVGPEALKSHAQLNYRRGAERPRLHFFLPRVKAPQCSQN